jgi:hypothetical protein
MPRRTNSISGRINQPEQHLFAGTAEDLFDALAPVLRVKPVIKEFCWFGGAWRSARGTSGMGWAQFDIVARGVCSVVQRGMDTIQLAAGDILLLPHGDGHIVRSRIGGALGPVKTDFRNAIRANSSVGVEADTGSFADDYCSKLARTIASRRPCPRQSSSARWLIRCSSAFEIC